METLRKSVGRNWECLTLSTKRPVKQLLDFLPNVCCCCCCFFKECLSSGTSDDTGILLSNVFFARFLCNAGQFGVFFVLFCFLASGQLKKIPWAVPIESNDYIGGYSISMLYEINDKRKYNLYSLL